jgi:RNA polymerase sigma factor (sigma-70 family)
MVMKMGADPALLQQVVAGDARALSQWLERLWPELVLLVKANSSMRPLAASEDHVHNVVQSVIEKLSLRFERYAPWQAANPDRSIDDWLRIVTKNAIRDYLRAQFGPRSASDQPSVKRLLNEYASSDPLEERSVRPPFTLAETARELFEFAKRHLPPAQLRALQLWLEGASFDEIAQDQSSSAEQAQQQLHAGIAVLRRHFRSDPSKG